MRFAFVQGSFMRLSLPYLSASLREAGHQTALAYDPLIFGDVFHSPNELKNPATYRARALFSYTQQVIDEVAAWKPDAIGVTLGSSEFRWARDVIARLKRATGVPIVIGGPHPTATPDTALTELGADYALRGECDRTLVKLVDALSGHGRLEAVPNLWYRKDGRVVSNPMLPLVQALDELPFPDQDLYYQRGYPFNIGYFAVGSRGCEYSCTYCQASLVRKIYYGPKKYRTERSFLRWRSPANLIEELKVARRAWDIRTIRFNDNDLIKDDDFFHEFAPLLAREIGIPYKCFIAPTSVTPRKAQLLKESGCVQVQMGVQSLDPTTRTKVLSRHYSNQVIIDAINALNDAGVFVMTDNLLDLPGSTPKESEGMFDFYRKHRVGCINTYYLNYWANQDITETARQMQHLSDADIERLSTDPHSVCILFPYAKRHLAFEKIRHRTNAINHVPGPLGWMLADSGIGEAISRLGVFDLLDHAYKLAWTATDRLPPAHVGYELTFVRRSLETKYFLRAKLLERLGLGPRQVLLRESRYPHPWVDGGAAEGPA